MNKLNNLIFMNKIKCLHATFNLPLITISPMNWGHPKWISMIKVTHVSGMGNTLELVQWSDFNVHVMY